MVDADHADTAGMTLLTDLIPGQPQEVLACHTRSPVPALHAYADHCYSAMNGLGPRRRRAAALRKSGIGRHCSRSSAVLIGIVGNAVHRAMR